MCLNCLGETLALGKSCMRFYKGFADPPRNGHSTEHFARVIILDWDEQPPSAFRKL